MSLGANQVSPVQTLDLAVEKLAASPQVFSAQSSSDWLTAPWGPIRQSWFVNRNVLLETTLSPIELLRVCQQVEESLGRTRSIRWGPRAIDIDLIWASDQQIDDADLKLPHPRAHERGFVLRPWLELDSSAVLNGTPVIDLLRSLDARGPSSVCVRHA